MVEGSDVEYSADVGGGVSEPRQQRSIRTRDDIVAVAARVFDVRGYAAATMGAIISESYLTKGALYFHFPSKASIARYLVAGWIRAVEESIDAAAGTEDSAIGQLRRVCGNLTGHIRGDVALRAGMKLTLDPAAGAGVAFSRWVAMADVLVESAVASGEVDDSAVVGRLAWNVCAGMVGAVCASGVVSGDVELYRIDDVVNAHIGAAVSNRNRPA